MKKIIKKLLKRIKLKYISHKISSYKYLHIIYNDKFLGEFINFLNNNFNMQDHAVVVIKIESLNFSIPKEKNIYTLDTVKFINFNNPKLEKIFCHSLFVPSLTPKLYSNPTALKNKAYWLIYGGDLYSAPKTEVDDFVRSNFKGYIGKADEQIVKNKYKILNDNFFDLIYNFPIKKETLDKTAACPHEKIIIQINNSCDKSTLEVLDVLTKFKNENLLIKTIVSYGDLACKDEIIQKGQRIFGNNFSYIENYLSPEDYAQELAQNDILLYNQNRQQGVGNIIASMYLGKKIFIRSDVSTYSAIQKMGFQIFDTLKIHSMDYAEFTDYFDFSNNKAQACKFFDENYIKELWTTILQDK